MGKSGKKVKSDKINALRKQYDAFLEDDKKRKDRNEYILGRLDEMRSSTALMKPIPKGKSNILEHLHQSPYPKVSSNVSNTFRIEDNRKYPPTEPNMLVECFPKQIEVSIIREITKNYILIPKVQTFLPSNNLHNSSSEVVDTDWKSKYNILDELKQNEKESVSDVKDKTIRFATHQDISEETQENNATDININKNNNNILDISNYNSINTKTVPNDFPKDKNPSKEVIENMNASLKYNETLIKNEIDVHPKELTESKFEKQENMKEPEKDQNYYEPQDLRNVQEKIPEISLEQTKYDNSVIESTPEPQLQEENIPIRNDVQDLPNENEINVNGENHPQNVGNEENIVESNHYEIEETAPQNQENIVESQHYGTTENPPHNEENIAESQQYESNEGYSNNEQGANLEVNELEKEQHEMFYAENPEKNIEYDQTNVNEQPQEYPADTENYTNEQYSYYDESQQQQPYPSEINEHEESTEQYDPNYQQQYAENYENAPQYENQQYQEQYQDNTYEQQQETIISSENYGEMQQGNENFEHSEAYQNHDGYALENQTLEEQNYEAQQYYNEQQDYTEVPSQEYVQEEYNQVNQEPAADMQEELYREEGTVDPNAASKDNVVEPNTANNTAVANESSLKVS